jgi:hypothetical protein
MSNTDINPLDFIIDKLTNSIENTSTGEVFNTDVVRMIVKNLIEIKDKTKEVYKLTMIKNPTIIQGLVSIEDKQDHIFMHLIESA